MQIVENEHCFQVYNITGSAEGRKDLCSAHSLCKLKLCLLSFSPGRNKSLSYAFFFNFSKLRKGVASKNKHV